MNSAREDVCKAAWCFHVYLTSAEHAINLPLLTVGKKPRACVMQKCEPRCCSVSYTCWSSAVAPSSDGLLPRTTDLRLLCGQTKPKSLLHKLGTLVQFFCTAPVGAVPAVYGGDSKLWLGGTPLTQTKQAHKSRPNKPHFRTVESLSAFWFKVTIVCGQDQLAKSFPMETNPSSHFLNSLPRQ